MGRSLKLFLVGLAVGVLLLAPVLCGGGSSLPSESTPARPPNFALFPSTPSGTTVCTSVSGVVLPGYSGLTGQFQGPSYVPALIGGAVIGSIAAALGKLRDGGWRGVR